MSRLVSSAIAIVVLSTGLVRAQDDPVPLGDVARSVRKSKPPSEHQVIDNDNFRVMMDKAESARLKGEPIFAVGNAGKSFTAVSPDGICSLSFDARTIQRMQIPYVASELPGEELFKLDGPAAIQGGVLQVALHNGTRWQLKEIVVALTAPEARKGAANASTENDNSQPAAPTRLPDRSLLYHLHGTGAPKSVAVFQAALEPGPTPRADWRWTIVAARGIRPASARVGDEQQLETSAAPAAARRLASAPPGASSQAANPAAGPSPATKGPAAHDGP
jgi:hypothetical protein